MRHDQDPALAFDVTAFLDLMHQLPPHKLEWFKEQLRLMDAGQPNAMDGTAPIPDFWTEEANDAV